MSEAQMIDLREQVVAVLKQAGKPLRTPEIEFELKVRGDWTADTFDVRDAVSRLIADRRAEFVHPGYLVKLTDKS